MADGYYGDASTVLVHPLSETGLIEPPAYLFKYNSTHPSPRLNDSQVQSSHTEDIFDPSGKYLFIPDGGADRLYAYHVAGPSSVLQVQKISLPPGTGPRHITFNVFNATRSSMYLVSELDSVVRVFTLDGVSNLVATNEPTTAPKMTVTLYQTISTIGPGEIRTAPINHHQASEIALSNDVKFAEVRNRDTTSYATDTLAVCSVNQNRKHDGAHLTYNGLSQYVWKNSTAFLLVSRRPESICSRCERVLAKPCCTRTRPIRVHGTFEGQSQFWLARPYRESGTYGNYLVMN